MIIKGASECNWMPVKVWLLYSTFFAVVAVAVLICVGVVFGVVLYFTFVGSSDLGSSLFCRVVNLKWRLACG